MLIDHWPLMGLQMRTARLELRLPAEEELAQLADVAAQGIHEPGRRVFMTPWTDLPPAERARAVLRGHWRQLGSWSAQDWTLPMAVFADGRPVGVQEVEARDFATRREVRTASWLGSAHQGRGIGTEMRAAILHLAFAGLGAVEATTGSFADNAAPLGVSRKLGYQPDGITRDAVDGRVVVSQRLRLSRAQWEATDRPQVTVSGLAPCLEQFGLDRPGAATPRIPASG